MSRGVNLAHDLIFLGTSIFLIIFVLTDEIEKSLFWKG